MDAEKAAVADDPGRLELERLRALQGTGLLSAPELPELDAICGRDRGHFQAAVALVSLIDKDRLVAKARSGTDLAVAPRVGQFCDVTIRSDDVFVVPDASKDERFASNAVVTGEPYIRFYAGAPLIYRSQIRLGALALLDPSPREFSLGDKAEPALMADEAVSVILEHEFKEKFSSARH